MIVKTNKEKAIIQSKFTVPISMKTRFIKEKEDRRLSFRG